MNASPSIRIEFAAGTFGVTVKLNDSPTGRALTEALPLEGSVHRWGDEIDFSCTLDLPLEPGARAEVPLGAVAYRPEGPALCLLCGPTPVSTAGEPRACSAGNLPGRIPDDLAPLAAVPAGTRMRVQPA